MSLKTAIYEYRVFFAESCDGNRKILKIEANQNEHFPFFFLSLVKKKKLSIREI